MTRIYQKSIGKGCLLLLFCLLSATAASGDTLATLRKMVGQDIRKAHDYAERIIKEGKNNPDLMAAVGTVFLKEGEIKEAEYFYEKGYHQKRITTTVINLAGDIALAKNDREKARYWYERAIYFDKRDPQGYFKLADLLTGEEAGTAVERLKTLETYRKDCGAERKIAQVWYASNKFENAAEAYAAISRDSLSKEDLVNYALSLYFLHQYQESADIARYGLGRYAGIVPLQRLVMYDLTELQDYAGALAVAKDLFQEKNQKELQYLDFIYHGYALNGTNHYDEAIATFSKALELNDGRADVVQKISEAYENIGDHDHAIAYYKKYIDMLEEEDRTAFVVYKLGQLYYWKGTDDTQTAELTPEKTAALKEADSQFERVEQMRPDSYLGAYWRARACSALDPQTERGLAKPHYQKVITLLQPQDANSQQRLLEAYKYLAYYYYVKKDKTSSRQYVDKILAVDANDSYASQMQQALSAR